MSDVPASSEAEDAEWQASMGQPVTRGELLYALQVMQAAMLNQASVDVTIMAHIESMSDEKRAGVAETTVNAATRVLEAIKTLVTEWRRGSDIG